MIPPDNSTVEFDVYKFLAGVAGAVASLRFVNGTVIEKFFMVLGGASLSYFGTGPLSDWAKLPHADGLLGFLIGLFGMAAVSKLFDVINALDAVAMAADLWSWAKKRLGIGS